MGFCRNCSHFDYEHEDIAPGEPCAVTYGIWSDWPMTDDFERCLCEGFEPEPLGVEV